MVCRVPPGTAPGKENLKKKLKKSLPGAYDMAPGKARDDEAGTVTLFFAGRWVCTRQSLCRVSDKKHPAKKSLPTNFLPEALCRVLHPAKALPSAKYPLPSAFGTRQSA